MENDNFDETQIKFRAPTKAKPFTLQKAPTSLEELDIPQSLVEDSMLRYLYSKGNSNIRELSNVLKLSFPLLHELFQKLRQKKLFEITGMEGNDYIFGLSGRGHDLAAKRFAVSHYSGPTPVSINNYNDAVRRQVIEIKVSREMLKKSLSDLVLTDKFIDQIID